MGSRLSAPKHTAADCAWVETPAADSLDDFPGDPDDLARKIQTWWRVRRAWTVIRTHRDLIDNVLENYYDDARAVGLGWDTAGLLSDVRIEMARRKVGRV